MRDAVSVCGVESVGNLNCESQGLWQWQRTAKGNALDVIHHQIIWADIVQCTDMRMVQRRNDSGFAFEAVAKCRFACERLPEDLDSNCSIEPSVLRTVNLAHAAGANGGDNL